MKSVLKGIGIFLCILLVAALLAPVLFQILPFKFERIFNRIVMILSLGAILMWIRQAKIKAENYYLQWIPQTSFDQFLKAFLVSFGVMSTMLMVKVFVGATEFKVQDFTWLTWLEKLSIGLIGALLIGVIEEFFFRGVVFKALLEKAKCPVFICLLVTSLFYALLHFIDAKKPLIDDTPTFWDSLRLIAAPLKSFAALHDKWAEVFGLFLFGWVLSDVVLKTKSLYPAIGIHAGCVFFLKLDGAVTYSHSERAFWLTSWHMYDGVLGWFFILLIGFLYRKMEERLRSDGCD